MNTPMVHAEGVRKHFGKLQVLKGIDLTVERGQVCCLLGPSGSGKSTFLRCINHLEKIDGGKLTVDGELVGYALYHTSYSTEFAARGFYLYDLFVADAARGRGVGRALVAGIARAAKADGRSFVWWCSKAWNVEAQAFYERLGAVEEDIKAHAIWGDAFDRLADSADGT